MIRYIIVGIVMFLSARLFAEDSYYLNTLAGCRIDQYFEGKLTTVSDQNFVNRIINPKKLPRNPELVAFKLDNEIYVTRETCVISARKKEIPNQINGLEVAKKKVEKLSEKEKFNSYQHFIEVDLGVVNISDQNSMVGDYNQVFPSTSSTNPTSWGQTANSAYKTSSLITVGFGFRSNHTRFLAFKLRLIKGKKTDTVDLTDINTSVSQSGAWTFEDSFKNLYVGYKYVFLDYSAWKPVFGIYLGVSHQSQTITDGGSSFELSSLGPAGLIEAGMEYHLNSHWGLGAVAGLEYLGKRSMKFADTSTAVNFKTNMSYTNHYFSFGVKYYFK